MALKKHPHFEGQIKITTGENDKVLFIEEIDGNKTATLTEGWFQVSVLLNAIETAMNSVSTANTYSVSLSRDTGLVSVSRATGSQLFKLEVSTSSGTDNVWTGGLVDSAGVALSEGQRGLYNLGFELDNSASFGTGFFSNIQPTGVWVPSWPPSQNTDPYYQNTMVESYAISGAGEAYVFNEWSLQKANYPYFSGREFYDLQFEMIDEDEMEQFLAWFWGPSAGLGYSFRYYDEWDLTSYREMRLTGEILEKGSLGSRPYGVQLYSFPLKMRGV